MSEQDLREEIGKLRSQLGELIEENRRLKEENEVLKRAPGYKNREAVTEVRK